MILRKKVQPCKSFGMVTTPKDQIGKPAVVVIGDDIGRLEELITTAMAIKFSNHCGLENKIEVLRKELTHRLDELDLKVNQGQSKQEQ